MRSVEQWSRRPVVAVTVDVEWAHEIVLRDVATLLDERGLRATFFCTHAGVELPGHDRALHPNFDRQNNTLFPGGRPPAGWTDGEFHRFVLESTRRFCPEAAGIRTHRLYFSSDLLPLYPENGLEYDSTYFLPLTSGLHPVWKNRDVLELPVCYLDHWDLNAGATQFELAGLRLDEPGLKVLDFHPNLVYLNAATPEQYAASKPRYHDPDHLRAMRHEGRGVRTLFLELLDYLASEAAEWRTLGEINRACRQEGA